MRIGMLTGGGDCPGLNAVIRAVVRKGEGIYGHELIGFRHGWRGVMEDETMELTIGTTRGLVHRGGTILGTSRTNPVKMEDGMARVRATPSSAFSGFVRDVPRIVPPRWISPRVLGTVSSIVSSSTTPRQPWRNPTISWP